MQKYINLLTKAQTRRQVKVRQAIPYTVVGLVFLSNFDSTAFMTSLDYEGRCDREDQIWKLQAHPQTVEWVWDSSFATWASSNEYLFWICGKPASGKSTIMESIAKSDKLKEYLKRGLNEQWTVVRHFFFDYGVSEDIRNNFRGFLRSLLYQLVEMLGGIREATLSGTEENKRWSERELQEMLGKVLEHRSGPVCILLDGLDEYQDDKWALVKFLQETAKPQIKLCIACRPDPVFDIAFKGVRQLRMQDVNKPAIEKMVEHTLQESVGRSGFYSDNEYVKLAEGISEKANGVFLWAHFAVIEIRAGWIEGEECWKLQKRLEGVPEQLEDIYARIIRRIKPDERQHAASMLQLVCYAKKLLTVSELFYALAQTNDEETLPTTKTQPAPVHYSQGKYFERKILALTGGLLEIFPGRSNGMNRNWKYETQDDDTSKNERREHDYINIIHRTVRTYLERGGWDHVLGRVHEGTLHAEMLWLRVCARLFPPSFITLPPDMDERLIPKRMRHNLMPKISSTIQNLDPALQMLDDKHLSVPGPATSLRNYAVLSMLDYAETVEKDLGLSSYAVLKVVLTDNFMCHHRYLDQRRDHMYTYYRQSPKPRHPLHLAIAHGLYGFVREFLFRLSETTTQDSPEWNDIFYFDPDEALDYQTCRISLLEFALVHAKEYYPNSNLKMQIVTTLLERYSRVNDAEMVYALQNSAPIIVQLLLAHWPDRDMVFHTYPKRHDYDPKTGTISTNYADKHQQRAHTRPLWHIAWRYDCDEHQNEELLDIFLRRGEDINGQCGPVGTALHGNLLHLQRSGSDLFQLFRLLIKKGADVNAHGPLGKPLEFVWRLAHGRWRKPGFSQSITRVIKCLIDHGAINEQEDPNGLVPSKEQMLAFRHGTREHFEELLRHYRGEGGQNEMDSVN